MGKLALRCGGPIVMFVLFAAAVGAPLTASAEPVTLASLDIVQSTSFPPLPGDSSGKFTLHSPAAFELFENFLISASDIGRRLVADAATDPDFLPIVGRFTNGRANFVGYLFGPPQGGGGGADAASEAALFNLPAGKIDFAGSTITAITLTIRDFSSGPSPLFAGATQLHLDAVLAIRGTPGSTPTPEPSTLFLLGGGIAAVLRRRRGRTPTEATG